MKHIAHLTFRIRGEELVQQVAEAQLHSELPAKSKNCCDLKVDELSISILYNIYIYIIYI